MRLLVRVGEQPNLRPNLNPTPTPTPTPTPDPHQVLEYDGAELDDLVAELQAELEVTVARKKELKASGASKEKVAKSVRKLEKEIRKFKGL